MADKLVELKHIIAACTAIAGEGVRRGSLRGREFPADPVLARDVAEVLFNKAMTCDEFAKKVMGELASLDMQ